MLESVFQETIHRFELCRDTDGRHVETNHCGTYFEMDSDFWDTL
jgi:hypothetical protein